MSEAQGAARDERQREIWGYGFGLIAIFAFALTLPASRMAVAALNPFFVALGRAVVAAFLAAVVLLVRRPPVPTPSQWRSLAVIGAGVVFGFPLFSTWAMRHVPASHGAVVIALLPLATAVAAAVRGGERPSTGFWVASVAGTAVVVGFAVSSGSSVGTLEPADLALFGSVLTAAVGYAEGGRLARSLGGWQVICWALLLCLPVAAAALLMVPVMNGGAAAGVPISSWAGFGYLCVVSQFLAFFAWYEGLALGGVARVGQLQLLQPFITVVASAAGLHEKVTPATWAAAVLVVASVALARNAKVGVRTRPVEEVAEAA